MIAVAQGLGQHWWADLLRIASISGCLWLAVLVIRLAWLRHGEPKRPGQPHLLTSLAYAGGLVLISIERVERWNLPPDWHLAASLLIVSCGITGALMRVRLHRPGSRRWRRDKPRDPQR